MKTLALLFVLAAIMSAGCNRKSETNLSKVPMALQLDDVHNHAAGTNAESYVIEACEAITVDPSGYSIPTPTKSGASSPNAIHLIHGDDDYFRMAWDGKSPATLTADSLKNVKGRTAFSGFQSGEMYVLGIGYDNFPEPAMHFAVMWVGMIKVNPTAQLGGPANGSQPFRSETNSTSSAGSRR